MHLIDMQRCDNCGEEPNISCYQCESCDRILCDECYGDARKLFVKIVILNRKRTLIDSHRMVDG